jgi:hypothetical protein
MLNLSGHETRDLRQFARFKWEESIPSFREEHINANGHDFIIDPATQAFAVGMRFSLFVGLRYV